jgi:DNA replication protein DnaC
MPCPLCDDTGWKPVEETSTHGSAQGVRRVVRCDCWRRSVSDKRLADANIPKRYQHCTIDKLRAYNDSLQEAVDSAARFVDSYPAVERGLLFLGHAGVGKTHLAVGVLRAVIQKTGVPGLFYDTRELLKTIRSSYDPVVRASETSILRPVMETPFLVLDDLGAERPTDWVEEMMNLIVNTRYNEKRVTLFTSNYPDIPDIEDPNSLLCRIGFRMRSRLQEMCRTIEIDAADFRDEHNPENASNEDLAALWQLKKRPKDLPTRANRSAKASMRDGKADLKWPGGRAGS